MTEQEIQAALERGKVEVSPSSMSVWTGKRGRHDLRFFLTNMENYKLFVALAIVNAEDLIIDKIEADTGLRLRRKVPPDNAEAAAGEGEK